LIRLLFYALSPTGSQDCDGSESSRASSILGFLKVLAATIEFRRQINPAIELPYDNGKTFFQSRGERFMTAANAPTFL